ncbi:MAG: hypothetical protein QNJ42_11110 [Crocosphaera sp.]|nr:hypothetical protein [Crocosphaera sp.]
MNNQQMTLRKAIKYQSYNFLANLNNFLVPHKVKKVIWIASYPRSGNTWFRKIIANLYGIDVSKLEKDLDQIVPNFERKKIGETNQGTPCDITEESVHFFKTHQLPFPNYELSIGEAKEFINYGYIYLYRIILVIYPKIVLISLEKNIKIHYKN